MSRGRLPEGRTDHPVTVADPASDPSERFWLLVVFGILCTTAVVGGLLGVTLLAIWWRGVRRAVEGTPHRE